MAVIQFSGFLLFLYLTEGEFYQNKFQLTFQSLFSMHMRNRGAHGDHEDFFPFVVLVKTGQSAAFRMIFPQWVLRRQSAQDLHVEIDFNSMFFRSVDQKIEPLLKLLRKCSKFRKNIRPYDRVELDMNPAVREAAANSIFSISGTSPVRFYASSGKSR